MGGIGIMTTTGGYMSKLRTAGGYDLFEVTSALQKTIRRGLEVEAVFWAQELESRYWKYLWQRLQVIAHEDIGPANPQAHIFTRLAWEQYREMREEEGKLMTLGLINTVVYLCRSPKSRENDHLLSIVYHQADMKLDIPDYAFDKHTRRGKQLKRGIDHFYDDGAKIFPDADSGLYIDQAREIDANKNTRTWWTNLKDKLRRNKGKKNAEPDESEQLGLF